MNEYVNQLIGLDWIGMNWYELVRKRKKEKRIFFSLVGEWCLVLDQQQQQAISLYTTRIQNNTYSLYIYIYSQLLKIRKILTR